MISFDYSSTISDVEVITFSSSKYSFKTSKLIKIVGWSTESFSLKRLLGNQATTELERIVILHSLKQQSTCLNSDGFSHYTAGSYKFI